MRFQTQTTWTDPESGLKVVLDDDRMRIVSVERHGNVRTGDMTIKVVLKRSAA